MKMIPTPTRAIRRMKAILFDTDGTECPIAASIGPPYEFEVGDTTKAVLYSACDNANTPVGFWVWEGESWVDLHGGEVADTRKRLAAKPAPVVIDCKLYRAAEDYTAYIKESSNPPAEPPQGSQKTEKK